MHPLSTATRVSIVFAAAFSVGAILLPYFPLFLQHRGLSPGEISVILGVATALRLFVGPFGALADRSGDRRPVFIGLGVAAFLSFLLLPWMYGFWSIFCVTVVTMLFWNPITPIIEAVGAMHAVRGAGDFGRMRSWGSATFIVVTIIGGMVLTGRSPDTVLVLQGAALAAVVIAGFFMPPLERAPAAGPTERVRYADLARQGGLVATFVVASLVQGSHAMLYSFASIHWKGQGFTDNEVGVFWAMGVTAEVLIFTYSARLSRYLSAPQWLLLGCTAVAVRWSVFPLIDGFWLWAFLQMMHALTFGATHIGTIQFISKAVAERQSVSAQSLYTTLTAVVATLVTLASGWLFDQFGRYAFSVMGGLGALALVLALVTGAGRIPPAPRIASSS